ncbi:MAG: hypothetical protein RR014_04735, partial [Bilophila sp.]
LDFDVVGTFGVLVVSNNIAGAELAEADALAVAEKVALTVHGATFGLPLSPALVKRIETATDGELAASGLSVWAVLWQQSLLFE